MEPGGGYGGTGGGQCGAGRGCGLRVVEDPLDVGSGGGAAYNYADCRWGGGGAVRLVVGGELRVDGSVRANGSDGSSMHYSVRWRGFRVAASICGWAP